MIIHGCRRLRGEDRPLFDDALKVMDVESPQSQRLRNLLEAKHEYDEAITRIDQCMAQGLLSAAEAAEQRDTASRALMAAKADVGRGGEGGGGPQVSTANRASSGSDQGSAETTPAEVQSMGGCSTDYEEARAAKVQNTLHTQLCTRRKYAYTGPLLVVFPPTDDSTSSA